MFVISKTKTHTHKAHKHNNKELDEVQLLVVKQKYIVTATQDVWPLDSVSRILRLKKYVISAKIIKLCFKIKIF